MLKEIDYIYMGMAVYLARFSKSFRKKVGCLVVSFQNDVPRILSEGVNGTLPGYDNNCEDENGNTYDYVIHAEVNALNKLKGYQLNNQCTLYVTHQPCTNCAKEILLQGISKVVYLLPYKDVKGLELLKNANVEVYNINPKDLEIDSTILDYSGLLRNKGFSEAEISRCIVLNRNRVNRK